MKKKGSQCEFNQHRDRELTAAFRSQLYLLGQTKLEHLWRLTAALPASRFWVSEERAIQVLRQIRKGDSLEKMNYKKREMFFEIHLRVEALMKENTSLTRSEAISKVINSPAPEFYLTPDSVRVIIYRAKGGGR